MITPASSAMSEADLLNSIREMARYTGWLTYHTHRSDRSDPGFPDLVLVRGRRVIYAELKTEKGRLSEPQTQWRDALTAAGQEWHLWRPHHLLDGSIAETLSRRTT